MTLEINRVTNGYLGNVIPVSRYGIGSVSHVFTTYRRFGDFVLEYYKDVEKLEREKK